MIAFAALENLGQDLGLGRDGGRFQIQSVDQLTLHGPHRLMAGDKWFPAPEPMYARDILETQRIESNSVGLSLATRLRLKHNNTLVREAPCFSVLFDRLAGRINSLSAFYGSGMLMPPSQKRDMLGRVGPAAEIRQAGNVLRRAAGRNRIYRRVDAFYPMAGTGPVDRGRWENEFWVRTVSSGNWGG